MGAILFYISGLKELQGRCHLDTKRKEEFGQAGKTGGEGKDILGRGNSMIKYLQV